MFGRLKSCLGTVISMVLVLVAAYGGWRWGDAVFPRIERALGIESVASEPVDPAEVNEARAEEALARVRRLVDSGGPGEVSLDRSDLTSLVRYPLSDRLPTGVVDATVRIRDDRIELSARVARERFPQLPDLGQFLDVLPDTLMLEARGTVIPFDSPGDGPDGAVFLVERIEAGRVPLPRAVVPPVLEAMGRVDASGLPPYGIVVPLPNGITGAYVDGDRLLLTAGGR